MPYKYSFGFKLSTLGKQRIGAKLIEYGYTILDYGWDFVITQQQLTPTHKTWVLANLLSVLLKEEQV